MKNKLLLLGIALTIVMLTASSALASDPMGPPTAGLSKGEWRTGIEYAYTKMDIDADGIPELGLVACTVKNVDVQKGFLNIGTGLSDNWEIFLRLGGANAKPDKDDNVNNVAGYIGSGSSISAGGGMKATLFKSNNGKIKWGTLAQFSWTEFDFGKEEYTINGHNVSISSDASLIEAQIVFGPTIEVIQGFSVYCGPFFRILEGDFDFTGTVDGASKDFSTDLEEDSAWGGYIGAQLDVEPTGDQITEGCVVFCEGQFTGDGWGVRTGIGLKF
ncbi:MAG: hypothetical protein U9N38_01430 [Thermodesulfobacteriota bacterium]|nr:hypothetical protein [Thermodesulfobacteriota bacterium]